MRKDKNFLYYISLISQLGLVIVISTLAGLFIGIFLDSRMKTKLIFTIFFLIIGLIGGLISAYRLIFQEDKNDKRNKRDNN